MANVLNMRKKLLKKFVIRKYVWATSAMDAIRNETKNEVHDVWLDEDWKKSQDFSPKGEIGFNS